jgi:hypothetical protein
MSKALAVLLELKDCSDYWGEYDVPIGIHERIDEAIQELLTQPEQNLREGISLRDHFAGLAMQVLLVEATSMNNAASNSYDMADLMMAEREKRNDL